MSTDLEMCSYSAENTDLVVWRDALNEHLPKYLHLPESITACLEARHAWCELPSLLFYNYNIGQFPSLPSLFTHL